MAGPTRFINGVGNSPSTDALGGMMMPDFTRQSFFSEDFMEPGDFVAATPTNWIQTLVGTGAITAVPGEGGLVDFTNSAADDDSISQQMVATPFAFNANRVASFKARMNLSDVTQSDMLIGITAPDTTPIGAVAAEQTGVDDGVFFLKRDESPVLEAFVRVGGVTVFTAASLGTLVDATFFEVGFFWTGLNTGRGSAEVSLFLNNSKVGKFVVTDFASQLPSVNMSVNMSIQNGEAVAKTMVLDNVVASFERDQIGPFTEQHP